MFMFLVVFSWSLLINNWKEKGVGSMWNYIRSHHNCLSAYSSQYDDLAVLSQP